ncbi:MAG: hypothetical protein Q9191_003984 [Dirinaria sp. TL-2023a]
MAPTLSLPVDKAQISNTLKASTSSDTTTNAFFGSCAVVIGVITIWQGRRVWKLRHVGQHDGRTLSHGDQAHHLSERIASTPSHEAHPPPQQLEDIESIAPAEDNPARAPSGDQTTEPGNTSTDSCPDKDGPATTASPYQTSEARFRTTIDEGSSLTDLRRDGEGQVLRNEHSGAHNID